MFSFTSDQRMETPITYAHQDPFFFRYGYARAGETREVDDAGQDSLAFRIEDRTFTFVLCDGVSLSFCGDIAAQFLSVRLLDWLHSFSVEEVREKGAMADALNAYLEQLVDEATGIVEKHPLPASIPPLVRDVLEEKRTGGSEAMFVCGRVDILNDWSNEANLFLGWSGDLRIRAWSGQREVSGHFQEQAHSHERWSTKRGIVNGNIHTAGLVDFAQTIDRLVIYSDGFTGIDSLKAMPSTAWLQQEMVKSFRSPTSDDISFLDIAW
ncbi:hypothetical protein [Aneurinibacillus tyrosinisolvens]|uniref:hypothetical protein n=1 Tax=Aneurinibacillus tyrosinisolvens TaxID=1443435 RepID=UPI00069A0E64|nr:hypothetical protein [Aneurinibacillus tyrosinisolvens]